MVQHKREGQAQLLDFYGHTPRLAPPREDLENIIVEADYGQIKQTFHIGAGTIAGSGLALGFSEAIDKFGTMGLPELTAQAICLAREGSILDKRQADVFQIVAAVLESNTDALNLYGNGERLLQEGELWRNEALADVLETWAQEGARFMSEGEIAKAVLALTEEKGALRLEDMRDYEVKYRKPLEMMIDGRKLSTNPPPSAGGVLVHLALSLLEENRSAKDIASTLTKLHHAREALGHIADPSKGEALLDPEVIAELHARPKAWRGTTHISAIDRDGLGASLSLTNGAGAGLIAKGTGIHLNDMLGEPELIPEAIGAFPENVRLCSMMSPTIVSAADDFIVLGAAGSTRIPSALVQTLLPLLAGESCAKALRTPRIHYEGGLSFENLFQEKDRKALLQDYPDAEVWQELAMFFGGVNLVRSKGKTLDGAGDPRRDSVAIIE
jgi:gamma-glutamyltranspeptidase/glutathione hydrolase